MGRLAVLVCVVLLSAAMANGIRTAGTVGTGAPGPEAVATTASTSASEVAVPTPPASSAKDSKRKVPNGPDPIHNRY
ncbi:hypothetical protein HU200_014699 [Digitaria exilis]|uniref:Uncharacterized protein n=1 Tax=Digitaria exilis TaxID=1010633 RepID=A0A835FC44_9POAL|nr:hypothetical protein HU200_014699 [Digitaria exilis]